MAGRKHGRARRVPRAPDASAGQYAGLDKTIDALAHPVRRGILLVLYARGGSMPAGQIAQRFAHSWPTTTRHLGVLEEAGLVSVEEDGRQRLYRLEAGPLRAVRAWVDAISTPPAVEASGAEHWTNLPFGRMRNTIRPGEDEQ